MIEATLDRTLVEADADKQASEARVQGVLQDINETLAFERFIEELVRRTGFSRSQIEDRVWELLNSGQAVLSPDFTVRLRR
jgi:hypothetical protein